MVIDEWLILAYIMLFSSIILCGILPIIIRLLTARRRFNRYQLERQAIEYSCPHAFLTRQSIYSDVQIDISDIEPQSLQRINSHEQPTIYTQIPFIDDAVADTLI